MTTLSSKIWNKDAVNLKFSKLFCSAANYESIGSAFILLLPLIRSRIWSLQRVVQINTKYMYESGLRVFTSMWFALRQIQVSPATKLSKEREEIKNNEKGKYFFCYSSFIVILPWQHLAIFRECGKMQNSTWLAYHETEFNYSPFNSF